MYLGANVSSAGGVKNSVIASNEFNINSIQIMPTAPMRWISKPIAQEEIESFVQEIKKGTVLKKVLVHSIYLTNLARKDKQLFHLGKLSLSMYLDFAEKVTTLLKKEKLDVEILGICFHPGSQKELSFEDSIERIIYGMNWVLDEVKGDQKLLVETTAGTGGNLGRTLTELKLIREGIKQKERVGFVLDTQHMYAAGYDWVNNLDGIVEEIEEEIGISNVKAIHVNDSMPDCGTNKDRHANLGEGKIGEKTMSAILQRKEFKNIPFILETPALKSKSSMIEEISHLKRYAKEV